MGHRKWDKDSKEKKEIREGDTREHDAESRALIAMDVEER